MGVGFAVRLDVRARNAFIAADQCFSVADYGLYNGGTAGVIWMTVGVLGGALCMVASMAEMASMAPTAGGQYHWVSEFAPPRWEKPLSYLVGWTSALGWVTGCPSAAQITGFLVQGLVYLKNADADFSRLWQTTLLIMAFLVAAVLFNLFLAKQLPLAEGIFLIVHIFGFFAFLIVLWTMSEHAPASEVFGQFQNYGAWSTTGVSTLVGITTPLWCFLGPDAGAHMSEELKDASRVLPSAMMWATICNACFGLIMMITYCFCLGPDWQTNVLGLDPEQPTQTGVAIIQVIWQSTNSIPGTIVMTFVLILLSMVGTITCIASSSRQVWAFARDRGFPFSSYIEYVRPGWDLPVNAILVVLGVSLAISALNFGSEVALAAIISLSNAGLLFSYIAAIGCVRLKRFRREPLLPRRWSLGKWGWLVNDVALAFLSISFVMSFFPIDNHPAPADMNWAIVMFAFVLLVAGLNYWFRAHKTYMSPVSLVKSE